MSLTVDGVRAAIVDSGVLSSDELESAREQLPDGRWPEHPGALLDGLYLAGYITKYQAKQFYAGKGNELLLGEYLLVDQIGAGGMGQVFKARHRRMKREVALKILPPAVQQNPGLIARFQREVEAAAKLNHPHVVVAFDAGESRGVHYLVTEYVPGSDLATLVKNRGPLSPAFAIELIVQAALGLDYAHRRGVIHRDIKPSNFLVSDDGVLKVADLGLARVLSSDVEFGDGAKSGDLTQTGAVMGTVDYMSPEQAEDTHRADARSDIYSLGCTLYFVLTGQPMFAAGTVMQRLLAHREQTPPMLTETLSAADANERAADPSAPTMMQLQAPPSWEPLQIVYEKMIAKRPEDRYQSMSEVLDALEPLRQSETAHLRRHVARLIPAGSPGRTVPSETAGSAHPNVATYFESPPLPTIVTGDTSASPFLRKAASRQTVRRPQWVMPTVIAVAVVGTAIAAWAMFFRGKSNNSPAATPAATQPVATSKKNSPAVKPPGLFDPALIPAKERFAWQPKELAAVLGTHDRTHWSTINSIQYADDGKTVFTAALDGWVTAWDGETLERLSSVALVQRTDPNTKNPDYGHTIAWDPKRQCLWVGTAYSTIRRLDWSKGQLAEKQWWPTGTPCFGLALSAEGRLLASVQPGRGLLLWDLQEDPPRILWRPESDTSTFREFSQVLFTPDGRHLAATESGKNAASLWKLPDVPAEGEIAEFQPQAVEGVFEAGMPNLGHVFNMQMLTATNELMLNRGQLEYYRCDDDGDWTHRIEPWGHEAALMSPDGRWQASVGQNAHACVFDRRQPDWQNSRNLIQVLPRNYAGLAYRPDSRRLLISDEQQLIAWDTTSFPPKRLTERTPGRLGIDLQFSPDGKKLAVAGSDDGVALWELEQGRFTQRHTWEVRNGFRGARGVSWSGDSQSLVFYESTDAAVALCVADADSKAVDRLQLPSPTICSAAISADGRRCAAARQWNDTTIHVFEREAPDASWHSVHELSTDGGVLVETLAFSPDGTQLAALLAQSAKNDGIRIWDFKTSPPRLRASLGQPHHHAGALGRKLAWTPDGKTLLAQCQHNSIQTWDMTADQPVVNPLGATGGNGLCVSPRGQHIAVAGADSVSILSAISLLPSYTYKLQNTVHAVDWHPSGDYLATANGNGTVYILEVPEHLQR